MPVYKHREQKDRMEVYHALRRVGLNSYDARKIMDWSEGHIQQYLKANQFPELTIKIVPLIALREKKKVENEAKDN